MARFTLDEVRARFSSSQATKSLEAAIWRTGDRRSVGMLHVLEPGLIIFDSDSRWTGILQVSTHNPERIVLCSDSLMPWGGSFAVHRSELCGPDSVGGDIHHCGFEYWIDLEYNRDEYVHFMMTETEWRELHDWLRLHGLEGIDLKRAFG